MKITSTMSSPAKKRKLNGDKTAKPQSKGLEYFFSKQRLKDSDAPKEASSVADNESNVELTDEELARKLQAEWDREDVDDQGQSSHTPDRNPEAEKFNVDLQKDVPEIPSKAETESHVQPAVGGPSTLKLQSAGMSEDNITTVIPLDESTLTFQPDKYVSDLRLHWESDHGHASYALLTRCFVLVSGTASRIKIVDTLVNCLRILIEGDPESLLPAVSRYTFNLNLRLLLMRIGVAGDELDIASVHFTRAGLRRLRHL